MSDPDPILQAALRALAEHLKPTRCNFNVKVGFGKDEKNMSLTIGVMGGDSLVVQMVEYDEASDEETTHSYKLELSKGRKSYWPNDEE